MKDKNPNKTFRKQNSVKVIASRGFYYKEPPKEPTQEQIDAATKVIIGHMKKGRYNRVDHGILETINKGTTLEEVKTREARGEEYQYDEDEHER